MRKSLRFKLLLLIGAGFLLTAMGSFIVFDFLLDEIIIKLGTRFAEKQVLYDKERSLGPILKEVALARKLTTSPAVLDWIADEGNLQAKKRGLAELESFRAAFADQSYFLAILQSKNYYYNDAANSYAGQQKRYTLKKSDEADQWFFKTLHQSEPCLLNVDHDEKLSVTKLWINCVVKDADKNVGVMGTGLDLSAFIKDIVALPQEGVNNIFIDASGAIQAHRQQEKIDYRSITKQIGERKTIFQLLDKDKEQNLFRQEMLFLKDNPATVKTFFAYVEKKRVLVGIAYLRELGWYNVTLMEIDTLVGKHFFNPFFFLIGGTLLVILLVFSFLIKGLLLSKITKLCESVRKIGEGNFHVNLPLEGNDEMSRLASKFKEMASKIEDYTSHLEEKVTERTRELQTANDTKDTYFSILAHDLRGPIGNLSLMLDNLMTPGEILSEENYDLLKNSTHGIQELLEELLNWSLSQRGLLTPDIKLCFLEDLLKKCMELFARQAHDKGIITSIQGKAPDNFFSDSSLLLTILRNLYSNALKFTPPGGKISFQLENKQTSLIIKVIDTGIGIPKEKISRLFQLGHKDISSRGTANEPGKGFGLLLCRELTGSLGGEIGVESSPGKGSTFWLALPLEKK